MSFRDVDFQLFAIAVIANLSLVMVVLRYAPKSQSRILFALFGLSQTVWIVVNFFAIRGDPTYILDSARWTIATAVPHPLLFFLFIWSFLRKEHVIRERHAAWGLGLVLLLIFLARSPYLFTHLELVNGQPTPIAGPGMAVFGIYAFAFIILAFVRIYKSWKKSVGLERIQWRFIGTGLFITFILVLSFNFLIAVLADEIKYVNFGHLYTLPFIVFTAYAMVRHNLLNLKAIVAELAVILLSLILFIQLVNSQSTAQFIINALVLIGELIVGTLLIRGVIKEVKQREQLQVLTEKLREVNKRLKILDKARSEFITLASHQLRTPPATMKWYVSAIVGGDFGPISGELKEALQKVQITNNSLISLIDDLLNVSRIERGKMEFAFGTTDLHEITQLTVDQLMPLAMSKKLKLVYNPPSVKLPTIMADREKLRQVINNLIDNAMKYTKAGQITVNISQNAGDLLLKVTDTGKGVRPEDLKTVFEKFQRGKTSSGLGLGLYLAKVVVEQHKGKIWVESPGEDKGSTFAFSLPVSSGIKATTSIFDLTKTQKDVR